MDYDVGPKINGPTYVQVDPGERGPDAMGHDPMEEGANCNSPRIRDDADSSQYGGTIVAESQMSTDV